MTAKPSRFRPSSSTLLAGGGIVLMALGLYFIFLRPSLLPEDPRYMGTSLEQIQATLPGLSAWLTKVFWVMGGYMFATGLMTCYIAMTNFRTRALGAAWIAAMAGFASIGLMSVVNFIIASNFKWLIFLFTLPWIFSLALYTLEGHDLQAQARLEK